MIKLSPSRANRWTKCTGSVPLELKYPSTPGPAATEGINAHRAAKDLIMGVDIDLHVFDPEMIVAVQIYVDTIKKYLNNTNIYYGVEEKLRYEHINVSISGIPDAYIFNPKLKKLSVFDFKTGFGVIDPVENWQLIIYTLLILRKLEGQGALGNYDSTGDLTCELVIVQPRAYHPDGPVRSWSMIYDQIQKYSRKLAEILIEIKAERYVSRVGPWCHYCRALHECKTAAMAAGTAMDVSGEAVTFELTPEQLSFELTHTKEAIRILTQRLKALEEYTVSQIQKGIMIPGWELSPGRGVLTWNKSISEIVKMADTIGVDIRKPEDIITPRQAEIKGLDQAIVKHYTYTREGKMKLRKEDPDAGKKVFGKRSENHG
jgi:hypothetical protein